MNIKSTIILLLFLIHGCAVNKKNISSQKINKTDTMAIVKKDTAAFNNKSESIDKSVEESNIIIEELITESIVDSVNLTTTTKTINRTIKKTYNKNNDITYADTTSISHSTIDTIKNASVININSNTTEIQKGNQPLKWLFLIALIALIAFLVKKFYRNLL